MPSKSIIAPATTLYNTPNQVQNIPLTGLLKMDFKIALLGLKAIFVCGQVVSGVIAGPRITFA